MGNYNHLSLDERQILYTSLKQGTSIKEIALQLDRNKSSLYRELARNGNEETYNPIAAEHQALTERSQLRLSKVERHNTLRQYVMRRLKMGWSPEQIAGRLKRKKSKYVICNFFKPDDVK